MAGIVCALSGYAPEEPVISRTGYLFEKRLIEKYISENGRCPMTGEGLSIDDLKPIISNKVVRPRTSASASLPGLLSTFQSEWDSLMTDSFNLKSSLHSTKEQLAHALYQYEAACRVIVRLTRERDEALSQISKLQHDVAIASVQSAQSTVVVDSGLPAELAQVVTELSERLQQGKKKRKLATSKTREQIQAFAEIFHSERIQLAKSPRINCFASHPQDPQRLLIAGEDHRLHIYQLGQKTAQADLKGHSAAVSACAFNPNEEVVVSGARDGELILWTSDDSGWSSKLKWKAFSAEVVAIHAHACGEFFLAAAADGEWSYVDWEGVVITKSTLAAPITQAAIHPDGQMLAFASEGLVQFWDSRTCKPTELVIDAHSGRVNSVHFGENGYYFATGCENGMAKVWDLRKNLAFYEYNAGQSVAWLSMDASCQFLAVGAGSSLTLHASTGKANMALVSQVSIQTVITGLLWMPDAACVVAVGEDGKVVQISDA